MYDEGYDDINVPQGDADDGIVMSGGEFETNNSPAPNDVALMEEEGEKIKANEGMQKTEVVPIFEGSIGSTCSGHRTKLRLCLEMNIKSKLTGRGFPDEDDKDSKADPVMVVVDYPDDVIVTVNAKIRKLETCTLSEAGDDELDRQSCKEPTDDVIMNNQSGNQALLNSTFVKVPLSSTMIYPIAEEPETSPTSSLLNDQKVAEANRVTDKSLRKSGSGNGSLYHTVMDDNNVGFGDISAILKMDNENHEKATEGATPTNNVKFGKQPSQKLNSSSMLFSSEKITPGEKLLKALHVLAKYRGVWGIYEDESRIVQHVLNLNRLLTTTDNATVYNTCRDEDFQEVRGLLSYFTLEKRFIVRSELLQTFTILSQKSQIISSFIFESDVPVVLAGEVMTGDCTSRETYAYASYLLQMLNVMQLSEDQFEKIGENFYGWLIVMIIKAEKGQYKAMADILLQVMLLYHKQLGESEIKWHSIYSAAENQNNMKTIKQKLMNYLLQNASLSPRSLASQNEGLGASHRIKEILVVTNDFIICNATRDLFSDSELDILLVTLIHNLESNHLIEFHREAVKAIYRILMAIRTEPSGMDKLERLVVNLLEEQRAGGGDYDRCYRGVLKKIYKILSIS